MKSFIRYGAGPAIGWLIVGLTVLPLLAAASSEAEQAASDGKRLEWLLANHDVRQTIYTSSVANDCLDSEAESAR